MDNLNKDISIFNFPWKIDEINSITLIGCGTAYHSCLMAKYWLEELTSKPRAAVSVAVLR